MIHRAQDLAHKFGYKDARRDTAIWYARNVSFLTAWAGNRPPPDKFGYLNPQGHHKFYYRQSPLDMLGWNTD
jgi:hypothetical protein